MVQSQDTDLARTPLVPGADPALDSLQGGLDMGGLDAETLRRGDLELVRRMAPGTWMYPILVGIVAVWTPIVVDHPFALAALGITTGLLALARSILTRRYPVLYERNARGARLAYAAVVLGAGLAWGVFAAFTIAMYGTTWTTMLVLMCTVGTLSGGTTALCLRRRLHTWWLALMGVPMVVTALILAGARGAPFAGMATLFLLFMWREARYLNRSFWRSLQKSHLINQESERKRRFLASVTHEIRTPMTCVLGLLQLVRADPSHPANPERLDTVDKSARELLRLVNDMLDPRTVDKASVDITCAPFDVRACIDELVHLVEPAAADKGLPITVEHVAGTPQMIVSDRGRVRQVLLNLLDNAVRFTGKGHVRVRTSPNDGVGGGSWLDVSIEDTGVGMSPECVRQALGDAGRLADSTGRMGLMNSSYLVRRMGGTICIHSAPGEGTRVVVTLPYVEPIRGAVVPQEAPRQVEAALPAAVPLSSEPEAAREAAPEVPSAASGNGKAPQARPGHVLLVGGIERESRRMQLALEQGGHHVSWVNETDHLLRLLGAHPNRTHAVLLFAREGPREAGELASMLRHELGDAIGHVAMVAAVADPDGALSESIGFRLDDIVSSDVAVGDVATRVAEAMDRRRVQSGGRARVLVGRLFV